MRRASKSDSSKVRRLRRQVKHLGDPRKGWSIRAFDPKRDLAPELYDELGLDREHSCDGLTRPPHRPTKTGPKASTRRPMGASPASSRGWGSGWPHCQSNKWVTITRRDGQRLTVHREIALLVVLLCDETERLGYDLIPGWNWGAACRAIRGSSTASNHSWALALDLNAPENPMGPRNGKIRRHPKVIALWKRFGFGWGGDYSGRADDMHMEFLGTPADAKRYTELAAAEFTDEGGFMAGLTEAQQKQLARDASDAEKMGHMIKNLDPKQQLGARVRRLEVMVEAMYRKIVGTPPPRTTRRKATSKTTRARRLQAGRTRARAAGRRSADVDVRTPVKRPRAKRRPTRRAPARSARR